MKTATATFSPLTILCASLLLLGAAFAAHAYDDSDLYMTPAISQPSTPQPTVIYNQPRMITDLNTGKTTTIIPLYEPTSNPGVGIYMDQDTGRQFQTFEYYPGAR